MALKIIFRGSLAGVNTAGTGPVNPPPPTSLLGGAAAPGKAPAPNVTRRN